MRFPFSKYQGTGNDFIVADNRSKEYALSSEQVARLCDRRFGVGADGLILLELEPGADFKMVYFNSDGRESSLCGNGGRCLVAFAAKLGIVSDRARFLASDGMHEAVITGDTVSLRMQDVKSIERGDGYFFLDTGSPHYVRFVTGAHDLDVPGMGRAVRYSDRFREAGTNVNFIEKLDDALFVRTYERGVEDETLSCGTGVTAAALVAAASGQSTGRNSCQVRTKGGALEVTFERVLDNTFYNVWLKGPAVHVFDGVIDIQSEDAAG